MKSEERRSYTMEAKALAEEQKRLNPDCWKRKRTNSVSERLRTFFGLPESGESRCMCVCVPVTLKRVPSRLEKTPTPNGDAPLDGEGAVRPSTPAAPFARKAENRGGPTSESSH